MNPHLSSFLTISLLACLLLPRLHATEYMLQPVGLEEGLSQSSVRAIMRDSRGYLWIGTQYGLNRYDNYAVANYYADPAHPSESLPDNEIAFIAQSADGTLLVGCRNGIARYDYASDSFHPLEADGQSVRGRSALTLPSRVLIGGNGSLYEYSDITGHLSRIDTHGGAQAAYVDIAGPYKSGTYLLQTRWQGLWVYDSASSQVTPLPFGTDQAVRAIALDDQQRIWVATQADGLRVYDSHGRLVKALSDRQLTSPIVLDLLWNDGQMWAATEKGLNIINPHTFETQPFIGNLASGRVAGTVLTMAHDQAGNIYAGTLRHGATRIYGVPMRTYSTLTVTPVDVGITVTSVLPDTDEEEGRMLVGIDGDGVARLTPGDICLRPIPQTAGMKVVSMAPYGSHQVLLATYDNGFRLLDRRTGAVSAAPTVFEPLAARASAAGLAPDVAALPDGRMAVVLDSLYIMDLARGTLFPAKFTAPRPMAEKLTPVQTENSQLLLHDSHHIYRYDPRTDTLEAVLSLPDADAPLSCVAADGSSASKLWYSDGKSLHSLDLATGSSVILPTHGMRNITALSPEGERLWVGADNKLFMLRGDSASEYSQPDGVAPNQFINKARLLTADHMMMGGVNGLLVVDRADIDRLAHTDLGADVSFSGIWADGRRLYPDKNGVFHLPADYSSLTLRIVDTDHLGTRRKRFRYYLLGNGHSAPLESADNQITISPLRSGRYTLAVAYGLNDGTWSQPVKLASLSMPAPWWARWWAVTLYIVIAAAIAFAIWYLSRMRRHARIARIERRALQEKVHILQQVHRDVRTPLSLIISPLYTLISDIREGQTGTQGTLSTLQMVYNQSLRMRDAVDNLPSPSPGDATHEPDATANPETETHILDTFDTSSFTAVVAESDPQMLGYLLQELQPWFKEVHTASNTADALIVVRGHEPDIVIIDSDISSPDGTDDGYSICVALKNDERLHHIPVVILIPGGSESERHKGYTLGADSLLPKPFHIGMLIARCKNLLLFRSNMRKRYDRTDHTASGKPICNTDESFMLEVDRLIHAKISDPDFGVDALARAMLMSRTAFYQRFQRLAGQSVGSHITDMRLRTAERLLAGSDALVSEIAKQLGFRSQRYFATFFKTKTGQTPTQYRSAHQQPPAQEQPAEQQ